jgi:hypothetical protein
MIGLFLAMLELMRQGMVRIEQDAPFAEIYLFLKVKLPEDQQQPEASLETASPEATQEPQAQPTTPEPEPESEAPELDESSPAEPEFNPGDEDDDDNDEENIMDDLGDLGLDDLSKNEKLWRQTDEPSEDGEQK